jgi:hypothetical protein
VTASGREPEADWVERLMAQYRDRLTGAVFDGIYKLEGEPLRVVMDTQADTCMQAFVALHDIPPDLDLDAFLERMRTTGPSRIVLDRPDDDTILWSEMHDGVCVCPHVRQGVIALDPKLCMCGATWVRLLIERHARRHADVSLVESVATGAQNCVYRITLGAPLSQPTCA